MHHRLLTFLRCPTCGGTLDLLPAVEEADEVLEGLLGCDEGHWFPVVRAIPRMLPDSLEEHWPAVEPQLRSLPAEGAASVRRALGGDGPRVYDKQTRENFSLEWGFHEVGDTTWGIDLQERVRTYFVEPIRIAPEDLRGKVLLDAGCGNGSQSALYGDLGLEVVAVDLSSGLEHGLAFLRSRPSGSPGRVHFVQGDLVNPPVTDGTVDIIHSAGVLHHTPDTRQTFLRLLRLLRPGGTFYIWLYKHERGVTPLVNSIRSVTTRIPPTTFAKVARASAVPFQAFRAVVNGVGLRSYAPIPRREAALALMDIFGAPHAHAHSYSEVAGWYEEAGFAEVWPCNDDRRGFGACGRLPDPEEEGSALVAAQASPAELGERELDIPG